MDKRIYWQNVPVSGGEGRTGWPMTEREKWPSQRQRVLVLPQTASRRGAPRQGCSPAASASGCMFTMKWGVRVPKPDVTGHCYHMTNSFGSGSRCSKADFWSQINYRALWWEIVCVFGVGETPPYSLCMYESDLWVCTMEGKSLIRVNSWRSCLEWSGHLCGQLGILTKSPSVLLCSSNFYIDR